MIYLAGAGLLVVGGVAYAATASANEDTSDRFGERSWPAEAVVRLRRRIRGRRRSRSPTLPTSVNDYHNGQHDTVRRRGYPHPGAAVDFSAVVSVDAAPPHDGSYMAAFKPPLASVPGHAAYGVPTPPGQAAYGRGAAAAAQAQAQAQAPTQPVYAPPPLMPPPPLAAAAAAAAPARPLYAPPPPLAAAPARPLYAPPPLAPPPLAPPPLAPPPLAPPAAPAAPPAAPAPPAAALAPPAAAPAPPAPPPAAYATASGLRGTGPLQRGGQPANAAAIAYADLELENAAVLGEGGFGRVLAGRWRGTAIAVKLLLADAQSGPGDADAFSSVKAELLSEARMLAGLRHPNITLFMGVAIADQDVALVTELVERGSLWDALRAPLPAAARGGAPAAAAAADPDGWPWPLVLRVATGAARGMTYLHCDKVLHRDLKSPNLLLDESFVAKICDFGLARLKAARATTARLATMTGGCGTVHWMAPEVLNADRYAEPADVYSFGIVMWELLSRTCPFGDMAPIQVAMAVLRTGARPDVPPWVDERLRFVRLMRRCWAGNPQDRPRFAEVLGELEQAAGEQTGGA